MKSPCLVVLFCIVVLVTLLAPAACATGPLWTYPASIKGTLSGVVIAEDGSVVVAGGDQLVALGRDGTKRWTGWSGSRLVISRDGSRILTTRDTNFRIIDGSGNMVWSETLADTVKDIAMTPDGSLVLACGGSRVKLMDGSGTGIRFNASIPVSHCGFIADNTRIVYIGKNGAQTSNLTLLIEWGDTNMTQDLLGIPADGSSFVTATNNRIRWYNEYGELDWEERIPGGNALALAVSRDGSTIVIGRDDGSVIALDTDGNTLWTAQESGWVTSAAVSDDGDTIVTGTIGGVVAVYDRDGNRLGSYAASEQIRSGSVAVSGDGSLIAAVDASRVYGFSRSQFALPAVTTAPTSTIAPETTIPPTLSQTTGLPAPSVSAGKPIAPATPKTDLPFVLSLLAGACCLVLMKRFR